MMESTAIGNLDQRTVKAAFYHDKCDKYDYLIAVGCGAVAGLVDVFMVGSPADSKVLKWTDAQADKAVMLFAKSCGWNPKSEKATNVSSAIGFLEKKFPVNYDQRHSGDVGKLFVMSPKNHHIKSLAHSPDLVGLLFSICNQFTSTSSFLSNGQLITIQTETQELMGHDFISKLFCGIANWFGHIMSDVAGSSGAVGRGSGIGIPFYELFQACDWGSFQVGQDRNTLAVVATKVFQEGYDARFGLAMALPVLLCDLSIKLIWALKHYFYHKRPLRECIPSKRHDDLRVMLMMGTGTLCLMDGVDAAIRSGGNWVAFFLRLNIIAWFRLAVLVLREICIRAKISYPLQKELDAYIRINEALRAYISELEKIDMKRFKRETDSYALLLGKMRCTSTETDLNALLKEEYRIQGVALPYQGSFGDFMRDGSARLEFK